MLGFHLEMRLAPPEQPKLNTRYDAKSKFKFDDVEVVRNFEGIFRDIRAKVAEKYNHERQGVYFTGEFPDCFPAYERMFYADSFLRAQKRVGIVLGSMAAKVVDRGDGYYSTDLDVMILNPHSGLNPRPFEWNVDWFVQPRINLRPTNSNVGVIYKVQKKPDVVFKTDQSTDLQSKLLTISRMKGLPVAPAILSREIEEKNAHRREISPGLYVPRPEVLAIIARYCNSVRDRLGLKKFSYDYLVPQNTPDRDFEWPTLGTDLVDVIPLV